MFYLYAYEEKAHDIVHEENTMTKFTSFQSFWVHTRQLPVIWKTVLCVNRIFTLYILTFCVGSTVQRLTILYYP